MPPHRPDFRFALALALAFLSLCACGRRGPLELPAETQARADALRAEQKAKARPGEPERPVVVPGVIGARPPQNYPFLLDPLL